MLDCRKNEYINPDGKVIRNCDTMRLIRKLVKVDENAVG